MTARSRLGRGGLAAAWGWLALVTLYMIWSAATERGLYGWLMRWQVARSDSWSDTLTFVLPLVILALPSIWILWGHVTAVEREAAQSPELEQRYSRGWAIGLLGAAGLSLAVGIGCGVLAARAPGYEEPVEIHAAELLAGRAPVGRRLRMMGRPVLHARYEIVGHRRRLSNSVTAWQGFRAERRKGMAESLSKPSTPIALFYEGHTSGDAEVEAPLADTIQITGFVVKNGLSDTARRGLEKRGVIIAKPHFLLREEAEGPDWMVGVGLGFLFAFILGTVGGVLLLRANGAIGGRRR